MNIEIEYRDAEQIAREGADRMERLAKRKRRREEGWVLTPNMARRVLASVIEDERAINAQAWRQAVVEQLEGIDADTDQLAAALEAQAQQIAARAQALRDLIPDEPEPAG